MSFDIYLERGSKRVFAGAVEWPGWCRSGRDEDAALEALFDNARRYAKAIARAKLGFETPKDPSAFRVIERLKGDATTDFGAPGTAPKADGRKVNDAELKRITSILRASWSAFDAAAKKHAKASLSTGPRGGGRTVAAMASHVFEADKAYLSRLGGKYAGKQTAELRDAIVEAIAARAHGEPVPPSPRRKAAIWTPRYGVRRSAWHALDHAWEIEDRA